MNIRAESAADEQTVPATAQYVYQVHDLDKPEIIGRILQADDVDKVVIFTRTKRQAQRVADDLTERGFNASPLHGDMAQVAREKAMDKFREDKVKILVATDVAARGIDVRGVSHVINYTCPEDHKTYVHRIGRTGRAGATGTAITFIDWADLQRWKLHNKELGLPFDEPVETYSTSPHLFQEQGIPEGTKGRIKAAAPVERKPREDRGERSGGRSGERREGDRPSGNRDRNRTRTRSGQQVAGEAGAPASTEPKQADAPSAEGTDGAPSANRNRNRRRRRSGGSGGSGGAGQAPAAAGAEG
jgi:superfamily II DNA/RNA helicase